MLEKQKAAYPNPHLPIWTVSSKGPLGNPDFGISMSFICDP